MVPSSSSSCEHPLSTGGVSVGGGTGVGCSVGPSTAGKGGTSIGWIVIMQYVANKLWRYKFIFIQLRYKVVYWNKPRCQKGWKVFRNYIILLVFIPRPWPQTVDIPPTSESSTSATHKQLISVWKFRLKASSTSFVTWWTRAIRSWRPSAVTALSSLRAAVCEASYAGKWGCCV